MRRLEIIHLRMAAAVPDGLLEEIRRSGRIFRHATLTTDIAVHLMSEEVGARIADALREYGLVNHSVWIEEEPCSGR
jgi:hypothetical protein